MRFSFVILCFLLIFSACKKDADVANDPGAGTGFGTGGGNSNAIPPATPVTTGLSLYASGNYQFANPLSPVSNTVYFNFLSNYLEFNVGSINADKYITKLSARANLTIKYTGYENYKTFCVLNSAKNYADMKLIPITDEGGVVYDYGTSTLPLPVNGTISLPAYSFGTHPGSVTFNVHAGYLNPANNDYIISSPSYPFADDNQKRWFLNSYGIYLLIPYATDNSEYDVDFSAAANVVIKLPIPAALLATAPDSIPTWNINSNQVWQRNGYALKVNSFYEKRIDRKGFWNFAIPVEGVYVTLHLRTSDGLGISNTKLKIKNGTDEIADVRTNADGDALVFVPANKILSMSLINDHADWSNQAIVFNQNIGPFTATSEKTIEVADRIDLATLEGNVFNCDGTAFGNGSALLTMLNAKDNYVIPITNGHFKTSTWLTYATTVIADLSVRDGSGTTISTTKVLFGDVTGNVLVRPKKYNINFYNCPAATKVYCNYRLDNVSHTINADAAAATPVMTATDGQVNIDNNGSGVIFKGWFTTVGNNYFLNGLTVNGVTCQFDDPTGASQVNITRRDAVGGFMEGWFDINYKDNNNVSHNITGNFRVKKVS